MKKIILSIAVFCSVSAMAAQPLSVDCNFMSTTPEGRYIKGRAVLIKLETNTATRAQLAAFTEPYDMDGLFLRVENKGCEVDNGKNCSEVTLTLTPNSEVNVLKQQINTYPQRATARTANSGTTTLQVIDQDFHPMSAGIVTYEADAQIRNFSERALKIKMACILKR